MSPGIPNSIRFLSVDDVLAIHENTIALDGGSPGLRDPGLLESAVLMPQQQFGGRFLHEGLAAMAAAYLFHVAQNHASNDGNKRAAVLSALVFLQVNGVRELPDPEELEKTTLAVAASEMSKGDLTAWMRERLPDA